MTEASRRERSLPFAGGILVPVLSKGESNEFPLLDKQDGGDLAVTKGKRFQPCSSSTSRLGQPLCSWHLGCNETARLNDHVAGCF